MFRAKTIEVKIPAGVATGSRVRVSGQGSPGAGGGSDGDVWLSVTVRPDRRFERSGDDLKSEIYVPLYTAVLGGEIVAPTAHRQVALAIPSGSQNGRLFRLRGQGMPNSRQPDERGDLLARIKIAVPEPRLNERELELFRELRRCETPDRFCDLPASLPRACSGIVPPTPPTRSSSLCFRGVPATD